MKVSVYSRAEAEKMMQDGTFPKNTAVISFYDPKIKHIDDSYDCLDYWNYADDVFYSELDDLDIGYLTKKGLTYSSYFPEVDEMAEYIYNSYNKGMDIICQCEYGQSRSAGCAAAILQHFYGTGIEIFADYRRYPNQVVYNKVSDALNKIKEDSVLDEDISIFCNLLDKIKKRPLAFIRKKSILYLKTYLDGYFTNNHHDKTYRTVLFPLDYWFLHEYAKIRFNEYESTAGWCNIILNHCGNDEEKAFDMFFEFYEDFRQLRMCRYKKHILTQENIDYHNSMEHCYSMNNNIKKPVFDNPVTVFFMELEKNYGWLMVVETICGVHIEKYIYDTLERVQKDAENYFGTLPECTETKGNNIDFHKKIY